MSVMGCGLMSSYLVCLRATKKNDTRVFSLAVLLSSTLVVNSRGTIDNRAIEELHYPSDQNLYFVFSLKFV